MRKSVYRRRFEPFRADVQAITDQILDPTIPFQEIEGLVGYGVDSYVYTLRGRPDIVARLPLREDSGLAPRKIVNESVDALVRGAGFPGLAQIIAYSTARPAAVLCEYIPGVTLHDLSEADTEHIPPAHFAGIVATFLTMQQQKLGVDSSCGNVIYDQAAGFTVIDYVRDRKQSLRAKVVEFASNQILLHETLEGEVVPKYGLCYRDVCIRELGPDMGQNITKRWLEDGLVVPNTHT